MYYQLFVIVSVLVGQRDESDGLCVTESLFSFDSSVLCSSTIGCLHICPAPISQIKILKRPAGTVGLMNSPQVSIYFDSLFIYLY